MERSDRFALLAGYCDNCFESPFLIIRLLATLRLEAAALLPRSTSGLLLWSQRKPKNINLSEAKATLAQQDGAFPTTGFHSLYALAGLLAHLKQPISCSAS